MTVATAAVVAVKTFCQTALGEYLAGYWYYFLQWKQKPPVLKYFHFRKISFHPFSKNVAILKKKSLCLCHRKMCVIVSIITFHINVNICSLSCSHANKCNLYWTFFFFAKAAKACVLPFDNKQWKQKVWLVRILQPMSNLKLESAIFILLSPD